jgi:4-amino-4-deoxy-L-arabinose transferase-like glycosyltransferase
MSDAVYPEGGVGDARRPNRPLAILIMAMAGLLYLTALGRTPLRLNAEIRCHDIVDAMVVTGDYLMPKLPGKWYESELVERVNKPPLFYWVSALFVRLHGKMDLFWFRLPSALAALGTLVLVLRWAKEMKTPAVGLVAATLLALMYMFVVEARRGTFEMLLTLLSGCAIFSCYRLHVRPGWWLAFLASLLFGLGFLTKATPILLLVLLPIVAWVLGMRRFSVLRDYRAWLLLLFGLLIGVSWYVYLVAFRPESRDRLLAEFLLPFGVKVATADGTSSASHFASPWMYLGHIWRLAFPASLLIPLGAVWVWKMKFFRPDSPWRLLLLSFGVPFVIFSCIPQKQDHYLLPLLPPLALLLAGAVVHAAECFSGRRRLWFALPAALLGVTMLAVGAIVGVGLPVVADLSPWAGVLIGGVGAVCAGLVMWQMIRANWPRVLAAAAVGIWVGWFSYFVFIRPVEDNFGSGKIFRDPTYNEAAWNAKFERLPFLKVLLDVERGKRHALRSQ